MKWMPLVLTLSILLPNLAGAASPWLVDGCGRGGVCGGTPTATFSPTPTATPTSTVVLTITGTPPTATSSPTFSPSPTATRTPVGGAYSLRVDVGATVGHSDGLVPDWVADQAFTPGGYGYTVAGHVYSTTDPVGGTTDPSVYRTFREDQALEYRFAVPNGTYAVMLHFCDFASTGPGQRVFSVISQAQTRLQNLDLFSVAGQGQAYRFSFDAVVTDGTLLVQFPYAVGASTLAGIEVQGLQQLNPLTIRLIRPFYAVPIP